MHGYGDNRGSCAHYLGNLLCCGQNDPLSHMFFLKGTILTQKYTMLRENPARGLDTWNSTFTLLLLENKIM